MLRVAAMPHLWKIAAKINIKPFIDNYKNKDIDIYDKGVDENGVPYKKLNKEKLGILGFEVIAEFMPQIGNISDDFVPFVAAYKGVTLEEAENFDSIEIIKEIAHDEGLISFFKSALRKLGKLAP